MNSIAKTITIVLLGLGVGLALSSAGCKPKAADTSGAATSAPCTPR